MHMLQYVGIACGAGFLAYCVYFDHKRRNAPDYKQKVLERRHLEKRERDARESAIEFPDLTNKAAIEEFFMTELQKGEEFIERGEIDKGVKRLSYAIVISGQPQQILEYLREVLPPKASLKLLEALPEAQKALKDHISPKIESSELECEDVE